jgi:hypothetical protein
MNGVTLMNRQYKIYARYQQIQLEASCYYCMSNYVNIGNQSQQVLTFDLHGDAVCKG